MRSTTPVKAAAILGMTAISFATVSTHAGINIIVNGGFESNNTNTTVYNMDNAEFNNIVNDVTGFAANGPGEFDIMTFGGGFGLDPVEGNWHVGLAKDAGLGNDQFSFDLTINIVGGTEYDLSFWAAQNTTFSDGTESLQIGISSSATNFGTLVYDAGNPPDDTWTKFTTTFTAPADAAFLTVRLTDFFDPNNTWVHIDDFRLSVVPVPCPADFDESNDVGVKDLLFLLGAWGPCPKKGDCPADFDLSGDVGVKDLLFLLGAWGPCP